MVRLEGVGRREMLQVGRSARVSVWLVYCTVTTYGNKYIWDYLVSLLIVG